MQKNKSALFILLSIILYFSVFFLQFRFSLDYAAFIFGGIVGLSFFWWEVLFYLFTLPRLETESRQLKHLVQEKQFQSVLRFLQDQTNSQALISRSLLFLGIYFVMAFFVITSTGSPVGVGLILGLGLRYCLDIFLYRDHMNNLEKMYTQFGGFNLNDHLFSQLTKLFVILFCVLSLLVLK